MKFYIWCCLNQHTYYCLFIDLLNNTYTHTYIHTHLNILQ
eukprot:UN10149